MPGDSRIEYLLGQLKANQLSKEEFDELMELTGKEESEARIKELWTADVAHMDGGSYDKAYWSQVFYKMIGRIGHQEHQGYTKGTTQVRRMWVRWVAAAVLVFIVCGLWFVVSRRSQVTGDKTQMATTHDVLAPANTRAVITLANGTKVYLDSVNNGTIAQENNVDVVKNNNGEIIYQGNANGEERRANSPVYNTLFNPRGSKVISLTLSDGTKVWLNSESSLKYPIAFSGDKREVEITGEAYFEVAHITRGPAGRDPRETTIAPGFNSGKKGTQNSPDFSPMPFIVKKRDVSVTVLGTHFNVNAYDDEESLKVTLLEGSVLVSANNEQRKANSLVIKPGEQAVFNANSYQLKANSSIDVDEVMAWKNGTFFMKRADIASIMRQVSRWYDVDVIYQNGVPKGTISGEVPRTLNLSDVLKVYELSGVKFKIEGKKVTVLQ